MYLQPESRLIWQVYSCGAEWGVSPPSVLAQFRAFVMTPECSAMLVVAIVTGVQLR